MELGVYAHWLTPFTVRVRGPALRWPGRPDLQRADSEGASLANDRYVSAPARSALASLTQLRGGEYEVRIRICLAGEEKIECAFYADHVPRRDAPSFR